MSFSESLELLLADMTVASLGAGPGVTFYDNKTEIMDYTRMFPDMRQSVMAAVNELNDELDAVYGPISELAQDHIHADECILTYGYSYTVELFLRAAAKKRRYQVSPVWCELLCFDW